MGLEVPADWFAETELIAQRCAEFEDDPAFGTWGLRAVCLRGAPPTMIGHVGFHSLPDARYLHPYWPHGIELAYTIYPQYRRMGHACEAVSGLIRWALRRASTLHSVLASIEVGNRGSRALAEKLGFVQVEQYADAETYERYLLYLLRRAAMPRVRVGRMRARSRKIL